MSEVTLKINNRGYSLACDDGQEQRLYELSKYVDSRLHDIAASGAATNESHLLVLTSLVLADEVYELRDEVAHMRKHMEQLRANPAHDAQAQSSELAEQEEVIAQAIEHLAHKIEHISDRIHGSGDAAVA